MRWLFRLLFLATISVIAPACHSANKTAPGNNPSGRPQGQSSFTTSLGPGGGAQGAGGETDADGASGGTPTESPSSNTGATTTTAPSITEANVYNLVGNTLYVLNHYRGLQIVDITNLDAPALLGTAPIYGYPSEMYLDGSNVYALVSDYYDYWDSPAGVNWFHGSQVRIINVANPANPTQLSSVNVDGDITDSRIVGTTLYLVAQRYSWWDNPSSNDDTTETVIVSVDVSDPSNVHVVDTKEFPQNGWNQQIMVTPYSIYVATTDWNQYTELYSTDIQYVDISDPAGNMKVRGSATVQGMVQDRWSMDEYNSVLRVASGQSWGNGDVFLTTWSVINPDNIVQVGSYTLSVADSLNTAQFNGTRGYIVSEASTNPIYTFDLTDPTQPQQLGQLQMSGYVDFVEALGTQLVTLGHNVTTGSNGEQTYSLAVSLIDATTNTPAMLSQVPVGSDWGWVPSSADDLEKVFQVLPSANLIMLPFESWNSTTYLYDGGVQLIDLNSNSLVLRGLLPNGGWVERAIPDGQTTVITLSDEYFQIMDTTDRDAPVARGMLELSRDVQDFLPINDSWAAQLSGDWYMGDTSLVLTPLMQPNTVTPAAEVHIPAPYGRLFVNGNMAYLTSVYDPTGGNNPTTQIQAVDLTDPTHPVMRGTVALPAAVYPGYHYWYWGYGDETIQVSGNLLIFHQFSYDWWGGCEGCEWGYGPDQGQPHTLYVVDMTNPDVPVIASTIPVDDAWWMWGLNSEGSLVYYSQYKETVVNNQYFATYYLGRVDLSNPSQPQVLPEINIPGQLVGLQGDTVYTEEQNWDDPTQAWQTNLHVLTISGSSAYLQGSTQLPGYVNNVIVQGPTAFISTEWYNEVTANGQTTWTDYDQLLTVDVSNPSSPVVSSATTLPVEYAWLQDVQAGTAFLGAGWGLLTYDVTTPDSPAFKAYYRTEGWSDELVLRGTNLFIPSDDYGVQIIDLTQTGIQAGN